MKPKKFPAILLTIALLFTLGMSAHATAPKKKKPPVDIHTLISAVSATSITVKSPKSTATYQITKLTTITYQNKTVTATDLKPGMRVSVTQATDPTIAEIIAATKGPKVAPAAKSKSVATSSNY